MGRPLVSIIIPVYNAGKHIDETISSALSQTWPNKEIIIVDDGSTDDSLSVIKKHEGPHLKILHQKNKGASVARNKGLDEATGDYIQFLDADDLLSAGKIAEQLNLLELNPGKIAVCRTVHFFDGQNPYEGSSSAYEDSFLYETEDTPGFLINLYGGESNRGSMIQTNAWLTPASVIKQTGYWSEFYSPDDDGEFFCRAVLESKGVVYDRNSLNYYRKYKVSNSLAASKTKQALQGKFRSFLLKKQHLLNATDSPIAKKALAHSAKDLAVDTYLIDKKLCSEILAAIDTLGGTDYVPKLGGEGIEFIKNIFGWKTARQLQYYYAKFFRV